MHTILIFMAVFTTAMATPSSRLPTALRPQHYKLKIRTYLPDNFTVEGKVWIQVHCDLPTKNITLHVRDLDVNEKGVTVMDITNQAKPETLTIDSIERREDRDFFIIFLDNNLIAARTYGIYIPWKSEIKDALDGFYRSGYEDKSSGKKQWIGATQFEPDGARKAFPCFDEPAMKATFDIILGRNAGFSSVSNMPLAHTELIKGESTWYWDKFDRSVPMSTYLLAWMVSDFSYVTSPPSKQNNVTFRVWARRDALSQTDYAKSVGPAILDFYERFFEIAYPLPKQDLVALPDFNAGAMENWGMVTFRETTLLYDPMVSSFSNRKTVASVVAHELAHQWFGNLVTMKWWNDLWLNEGFATFMASLALDKLYPDWHTWNAEVYNQLQNVFSTDVLLSSHPISADVDNARDIQERFDQITYQKGSLLIRMLSQILGEEGLRQSIVSYLKAHAYKNAEQEDFFQALSQNAHKHSKIPENLSIKQIMDSWTLQTGFPYITVIRDYVKNSVEVTQARYNPEGNVSTSCWLIPLSYTSNGQADSFSDIREWLKCPKEPLTINNIGGSNDWVLFNLDATAVMRVNYDQRNWLLLSNALKTEPEKIPVLNRAALIEDSFDLAWYGYLNYSVPFELIRYLPQEEEYLPWTAALSKFTNLDGELYKVSFYGEFLEYFRKLLTPAYEKVGGFARAKTLRFDLENYQRRIVSMACRTGVELCREDAKRLYDEWKQNPDNNQIPPSMRVIVYGNAIKTGGEKEWNFLWDKFRKSNVVSEKYNILQALASAREYWLLKRYLEWSFDQTTGIRRQDAATVFQFIANTELGYYVAKNYFMSNVKQISEYINSSRIGLYMRTILAEVSTDLEYEEMERFIEKNKNLLSYGKAAIARSLEKAKSRIRWHKQHLNDVAATLKHFNNEKN